ncbi:MULTISPECIES: right-handed parallel beta-helix repeat-containing protein [unclassified Imperialibacter]|uniref:right-handed parallel beta-helix repeat-containing protein n=1 Tax=unclassified Imperialibacter TaxID=2629706 RepID=UPI001869F638|nr:MULTISPECIES: right-handed parallel beta-helix repeat-containing protein [unclassified Imperialibacter]
MASGQIHIISDEVWEADTVHVNQNLIIDQGVTVTINSGTVVVFDDQNFIDVYGNLFINGSIEDSVKLTAPDTSWVTQGPRKALYGWGGLFAYETGAITAKYTIFEKLGHSHHSHHGYTLVGRLRNESTNAMTFENCRFNLKRDLNQVSEGCSIESSNAGGVVIKKSIFDDNKGAGSLIDVSASDTLIILETEFINNDIFGNLIYSASTSFQIKGSHFENNRVRSLLVGLIYSSSSSFEENIITKNSGAISLTGVSSSIFFRNNLYTHNGGQIYFELGNNIITGNVFFSNHYDDPYDFFPNDYEGIVRIELTESSVQIIANNSFIDNNSTAFKMWAVKKYTIVNNIFYNNYPSDGTLPKSEDLQSSDERVFKYNIYSSDIGLGGEGNLNSNPRINEVLDGFSLATNSPAIDKGDSQYAKYLLPLDALGNPRIDGVIDIGAIECDCDYLPLTDINISNYSLGQWEIGREAAYFTTTDPYDPSVVTFSLKEVNGVNNNYFTIDGDRLFLKKALTTESLLRIKIRAEHISGGWLEKYFDLTVESTLTSLGVPQNLGLKIFPNPTHQILYVNNLAPGTKYSILSTSGVKVDSGYLTLGSIDVSELCDGLYILLVTYGNRAEATKFYKLRQ